MVFIDHLVVKPSGNLLNLATTIELSDLDPCDRGIVVKPNVD